MSKKQVGTYEQLERVAPNLYRHAVSGTYYGVKKVKGRRKTHALGPKGKPTTDRKTADGFLLEWLGEIAGSDASTADMTFEALLTRFTATRTGLADGTKKTEAALMRVLKKRFPRPMTTIVSRIKTSDLLEFLGGLKHHKSGGKIRNATYNRYRLFLMNIFDVAMMDRVLPKNANPFDPETIPAKRKQHVERPIPTGIQFGQLIEEIRNPSWGEPIKGKRGGQRPMHFPESADFAEFLGRAGVGQAEASAVEWKDIGEKKIKFTRKKTGKVFNVAILDDLKPLVDRLRQEAIAKHGAATGRVFALKDVGNAIAAAAKRLGLRHFTQRNFRSMHIVSLLDKGVDVKFLAEQQGHSDGGTLLMNSYTEVIRGNQRAYEEEQIARANGKIVPMKAVG